MHLERKEFVTSVAQVLAVWVLCSTAFLAAASPENVAATRATAELDALLCKTGSPSLTAAVAQGGRIVWSYAAGVADRERGLAATPRTVYNIGSVSKAITAVAVAKLVEQGRVRLEDPIQRFVPGFPDKGTPITVQHLLTHSSGIRHYREHDFPGAPWAENHRPFASIAEAIAIFRDDALLFPPGKFYFYTSYGVNLLQGVVEAASGRGFEEYLREEVWAPAGMQSTALDVAGRATAERARGYELQDGALVRTEDVDVSYKYASGGMLSTAEDLARLGVALNHGTVLGARGVEVLFHSYLPVVRSFRVDGPPTVERFRQGLLWRLVERADGNGFAYHCGTFNGFNACLLDYRDEDLVVAMIFNTYAGGYPPAEKLAALFRVAKPAAARKR
jgi:CubicO group peptidase (beta-lactamase class C family)